jgi:DNA-directed RNA polymerase specialized sigma24 family protein
MNKNAEKLVNNYDKFKKYAKKIAYKTPNIDYYDLLHNTYLMFLENPQDIESVDGYFYEALKGRFLNIINSKYYKNERIELKDDLFLEHKFYKTNEDMFIDKLLVKLNKRKTQKKVLKLYLNGNNFQQIGKILNMKYDTVKANFRHIVTMARGEMSNESKFF